VSSPVVPWCATPGAEDVVTVCVTPTHRTSAASNIEVVPGDAWRQVPDVA